MAFRLTPRLATRYGGIYSSLKTCPQCIARVSTLPAFVARGVTREGGLVTRASSPSALLVRPFHAPPSPLLILGQRTAHPRLVPRITIVRALFRKLSIVTARSRGGGASPPHLSALAVHLMPSPEVGRLFFAAARKSVRSLP